MNILRCTMASKPHPPSFQKILDKAVDEKNRSSEVAKFPVQVNKEELKKKLTPQQYHVTQEQGTERAFSGELAAPHCTVNLGNKSPGAKPTNGTEKASPTVYTCIICSNELFSSANKFDSGCGWPAFNKSISDSAVAYFKDTSHQMIRIETTCGNCGAHLGHVFDDGPGPTFVRYCINAVCLQSKVADE